MKLLIDTHVFIWVLTDVRRLPHRVKNILSEPANEIYVSAVSFWEIAIKVANKRLSLIGHKPSTLVQAAEDLDFLPIAILPVDAATVGSLTEDAHFDPFDRMLIWQAIKRNMILVSGDRAFESFEKDGLRLLWK